MTVITRAAAAPQSLAGLAPLPLQQGRAAEAAAFHQVLQQLRAAGTDKAARTEALRMNRRLWQAVLVALADPESPLAFPLRQGLATLGLAVLREQDRHQPDLAFLIAINQQILGGLAAYH